MNVGSVLAERFSVWTFDATALSYTPNKFAAVTAADVTISMSVSRTITWILWRVPATPVLSVWT